jgi:hypothetical protein
MTASAGRLHRHRWLLGRQLGLTVDSFWRVGWCRRLVGTRLNRLWFLPDVVFVAKARVQVRNERRLRRPKAASSSAAQGQAVSRRRISRRPLEMRRPAACQTQ